MAVDRLIEEVAELKNSTRNLQLKRLWEDFYSSREPEKIPITVNWGLSFYAQILGIDLKVMSGGHAEDHIVQISQFHG
jgi:hypothetical protein